LSLKFYCSSLAKELYSIRFIRFQQRHSISLYKDEFIKSGVQRMIEEHLLEKPTTKEKKKLKKFLKSHFHSSKTLIYRTTKPKH